VSADGNILVIKLRCERHEDAVAMGTFMQDSFDRNGVVELVLSNDPQDAKHKMEWMN
jgi:hypothetical protein